MKGNLFKVIVLCAIVHNALISSPIPHLMKNREVLSALRMVSQAKNRSINNPHKRHIAAEAAVLSVAASSAAAPLFAAGICVGGACFAACQFYELYYGKTFVSAATQAAIKKALFYDEVNALKALELVKESKISFEAAYSKVFQLNQRALAIAEQTHESVEVVYKRLEYLEASPEVKYRLDQEALKEQALKNEIARELKNNFAGFQASTQSRHGVSAAQSHTESASLARSAAEFNQLARANPSPKQPLHTGHTTALPISDPGCTLLPPPQAETSIGCGSTTAVVPETPSGFQIAEQPNSTIVCEFPAEVQNQYLVTHKDLEKNAQAPGMPTENDGYRAPKKWDGKKVQAKNGRGYGYPDRDGNVWVPTGNGPLAHGGPHWDVQSADGKSYQNIMPGGHVRGERLKD